MSAHLRRSGLPSISRPVHQRLYCSSHQSAYPGLYSIILFVGPSIYGDLCCFLISRPVRQLGTLSAYPSGLYFYSLPVARRRTIHSAPYISRPLRGGFVPHLLSVSPLVEIFSTLSIRQPLRRDFLLHFLSVKTLRCTLLVGPAVEALHFISWSLRGGLYCIFYQPAPRHRGFVLLSLSVGPAAEALYCTLHQSAPPWRLCTALSISRPLRGGFVLHFLSAGPSVEALYRTVYLVTVK
jgi:hypothetical protein